MGAIAEQGRLFTTPAPAAGGCGWCGGPLRYVDATVGYRCPTCAAEIAAHRSYEEAVEWMRSKSRAYERRAR